MTALDFKIAATKDRVLRGGIGCAGDDCLLTLISRPEIRHWEREDKIVQPTRRRNFQVGFACDPPDDDGPTWPMR